MHDARPRLRLGRVRAFRRRRNQRLDELMTEADDLVARHVAADHAFGQPRLERLVDDAAGIVEVGLAASQEVA